MSVAQKFGVAAIVAAWGLMLALLLFASRESARHGDERSEGRAAQSQDYNSANHNGVPEPGTFVLLGAAAVGYIVWKKSK